MNLNIPESWYWREEDGGLDFFGLLQKYADEGVPEGEDKTSIKDMSANTQYRLTRTNSFSYLLSKSSQPIEAGTASGFICQYSKTGSESPYTYKLRLGLNFEALSGTWLIEQTIISTSNSWSDLIDNENNNINSIETNYFYDIIKFKFNITSFSVFAETLYCFSNVMEDWLQDNFSFTNGEPFLDFQFGGFRASEFNLIRVSDGSRFNDTLLPTLTDKTVEIPGADGMLYFNTYYKQRQFNINFVFNNLTIDKIYDIKTWLSGKEIKKLIFSESPDIYYNAKVTGTPTIKYLPFDKTTNFMSSNIEHENSNISEELEPITIYKGEGSVQFTCYDPYGYSIQEYSITNNDRTDGVLIGGYYNTYFKFSYQKSNISISANDYILIQQSDPDKTSWTQVCKITFKEPLSSTSTSRIEWDDRTGLVQWIVGSNKKIVNVQGNTCSLLPFGKKVRIRLFLGSNQPTTDPYEATYHIKYL